jgi:hypothetical protein
VFSGWFFSRKSPKATGNISGGSRPPVTLANNTGNSYSEYIFVLTKWRIFKFSPNFYYIFSPYKIILHAILFFVYWVNIYFHFQIIFPDIFGTLKKFHSEKVRSEFHL